MSCAQASCASQIRTAAAVTSEFGAAPSASGSSLARWAEIPEKNSERDVHRVVERQGLALPLKLDTMVVADMEMLWIRPKSWIAYLLKHNLWCRLCGLTRGEEHLCRPIWLQFWKNFQTLHPTSEIFSLPGIDLSRTAAFYIHGDEGRTLKRSAYMVTNFQCALGLGSQPQNTKHVDDAPLPGTFRLRLNNLQSTYLTRFVTILIPKTLYEGSETADCYLDMLEVLGRDLDELLMNGLTDRNGDCFRIAVIGVKGDLPFLNRVSFSERTFNRASKKEGSHFGICHLCNAGQEHVPAEQVGSRSPAWLATDGKVIPWSREPPLSKWLPNETAHRSSTYRLDIWHCFHLGIGRSFVASTIVLCLQTCAASTLEGRFMELTTSYLCFCKQFGYQAHIRKISKDFVGYTDPAGVNGLWSKGSLTTNLVRWLEHYLASRAIPEDNLLSSALRACKDINAFFSTLYDCDAFLNAGQCAYLSKVGRSFLQMYRHLAGETYQNRNPLYPLLPKLHYLDHFVVRIHWDGLKHGLSENPLQTACQMDEDIVGQVSRTSRRVSIRKSVQRTFQRYLMACHRAFSDAGWI